MKIAVMVIIFLIAAALGLVIAGPPGAIVGLVIAGVLAKLISILRGRSTEK